MEEAIRIPEAKSRSPAKKWEEYKEARHGAAPSRLSLPTAGMVTRGSAHRPGCSAIAWEPCVPHPAASPPPERDPVRLQLCNN